MPPPINETLEYDMPGLGPFTLRYQPEIADKIREAFRGEGGFDADFYITEGGAAAQTLFVRLIVVTPDGYVAGKDPT